jgi:hypothetical protein
MASLRIEAQDVLDVARDGIGWIALWKKGRSWTAFCFWPDITSNDALVFEDYEVEQLQNILAIDPHAIIVNSYYHNLGDTTCMTRDTLADALRWQYELQHFTVADVLENIVQPAQEAAAHEEQIAADNLDEMHKNEEPTEDERVEAWGRQERSVTLTNNDWNRLVCYLHLSSKYRERERDAWLDMAQEKNPDGTPRIKTAASNAAYWQEIIDDLERMLPKLDGMEV